jgi:hypothetical protein
VSIQPDIQGFITAQDRLRVVLGKDVTFFIRGTPVWPVGTQLNPETGRPFDPVIDPVSGAEETSVVKRAGVTFRPIHVNVEDPLGDKVQGGLRKATSVAVHIKDSDYADVQDAHKFVVNGTSYKLTDWERDDTTFRWIAFGEAR